MQILVLGGSGFVGQRLARQLVAAGLRPCLASRGQRTGAGSLAPSAGPHLTLDACDEAALTSALRRCDAVVNAVAGSPRAIAEGAGVLARALKAVGGRPLVHLSSMAVYGAAPTPHDSGPTYSGPADSEPTGAGSIEPGPSDPRPIQRGLTAESDWVPIDAIDATCATRAHRPAGSSYARAKREAEAQLAPLAAQGMPVALLRPGCVWGAGSPLWVDRIAALLAAGRLGDLGERGDGWTQGLHVEDLCEVVLRLLLQPGTGLRVFNLAAPDSPRWNHYLRDLAVAIGATPLRRVPAWQLALDACLLSPPIYLAQRLGLRHPHLPPLPPGVLRLVAAPMRMDCQAVQSALDLRWTPYERALGEAAAAWRRDNASHKALARNSGLPST